MQRRDALKRTALLLGYAMTASSVAAVMSGCKADPAVAAAGLDAWTPKILSKEQGKLVAHLAETIIPETDIPGAIEAGVHSFIDQSVQNNYTTEEQNNFKSSLTDLGNRFQEAKGKSFVDASEEDRIDFLTTYEKEAHAKDESGDGPKPFWFTIKELALLGYFTSDIGSKQALKFDPIPGAYIPCMPLEEVGGTWAI